MTSRNSNWNKKKEKAIPFLLKPAGKDYIWGGTRLNDDFSKNIDMLPLAETWECSTHPDGVSTVASGRYNGMSLTEVLKIHPEYLGTHPSTLTSKKGELPILIKFIDARKDLSVQVHPDDKYARKHENGSLGKTEMWYVLDSQKDTSLIYGFCHDITKEKLRASLKNGSVEKYLQKVKITPDDIFYIEAGIVHAIGAGALIVEIQENSNLTYRMYDYNRTDKDGNTRELHIEKALEVAKLKKSTEPRQPMRVLKYMNGCALELLCRCKYFQVERMLVNTERYRKMVEFYTENNSFQVLLCTHGCGVIANDTEQGINFFKGDCIFIPANSVLLKIHGKAKFLKIGC